jgi:hypothetical protein
MSLIVLRKGYAMKIFVSLLLALGIVSVSVCMVAADPVDLRDKKGVVDPKDLKKDDPKPPKVEGKAPPPPSSGSSSSTTPPVIGGSATGSAGSGGGVNVPITTP